MTPASHHFRQPKRHLYQFALDRFLRAQDPLWEWVVAELRVGKKQSHWMWFVFPQFKGLGRSEKAAHYAIQSLAEARAFLAHAVLGTRIRECCELLIALDGKTAHEVFSSPDDLKLASSMTLFGAVAEAGSPFEQVLAKYYAGQKDARTLAVLA